MSYFKKFFFASALRRKMPKAFFIQSTQNMHSVMVICSVLYVSVSSLNGPWILIHGHFSLSSHFSLTSSILPTGTKIQKIICKILKIIQLDKSKTKQSKKFLHIPKSLDSKLVPLPNLRMDCKPLKHIVNIIFFPSAADRNTKGDSADAISQDVNFH